MKARSILHALFLPAGIATLLPLAARAQVSQSAYDASGNLISRAMAATVPPQIVRQPAPQIVEPGHLATFSVVLMDSRGTTFQWTFNGANIAGATGDSLVLRNVSSANEGQYAVTVTNASGNAVSASAPLYIDSDGDGLPDSWEIAHFGNLDQTALGDYDGDGVSNLQEFLDGTDPTSNTSLRVRLNVAVVGLGAVQVTPLQASYAVGDVVTLTAVPANPYSFDHWSGDLTGTAVPSTLTLTANKNVTATFTTLPPPPGLIAWWRGEADASDLIAGHNGTFYSGTTPVAPTVTSAGLVGGAFSFDGIKYIQIPDASDLRPARFTAESWVYPTVQNASQQTVLARGSSIDTREAWSLSVVNGKARFTSEQSLSGTQTLDSATTVPLNQWTHLAISYDGYTKVIYVNGVQDAYGDGYGNYGKIVYDPAAVPVTIGSDWDAGASSNGFTGLVDEVSLYGRVLSKAEIAGIANIGRIGKCAIQPYFKAPAQLPDAVVGDTYLGNLVAVIGTAPITYALLSARPTKVD